MRMEDTYWYQDLVEHLIKLAKNRMYLKGWEDEAESMLKDISIHRSEEAAMKAGKAANIKLHRSAYDWQHVPWQKKAERFRNRE